MSTTDAPPAERTDLEPLTVSELTELVGEYRVESRTVKFGEGIKLKPMSDHSMLFGTEIQTLRELGYEFDHIGHSTVYFEGPTPSAE